MSKINISVTKSQYQWLQRNKWLNFSGFVRHIIKREMENSDPFKKHCKIKNKQEGYNSIVVSITNDMKSWLEQYRSDHNCKEFLSFYIQSELGLIINKKDLSIL